MKRIHRTLTGIAVALSVALGAAGTASAHPAGMGASGCMDGQPGMKSGQMDEMHSRMGAMHAHMAAVHAMHQGAMGMQGQPGAMPGMGSGGEKMGHDHGMMGSAGPEAQGAAHSLMTPEERSAFREKMRSAATREERQKLAQANRAEMEKRAAENGVTLPPAHGPLHNQ